MKISPAQIAAALKKIDNGVNAPTDEQVLVISSPLEPAVVVAGAGAGKTETMSARVLWLVINGYVKPDQILGLTFTRKAAGELAIRIRTRLRQLMKSDLVSPELAEEIENNLDVTVLTYHSYAARVLSEHAIRIGIDADATPIGEAAAWQIASDAVNNFESLSAPLISAPSTVIDDVMLLSKLIAEHGCSVADVRNEMERIISALTALPGKDTKEIRDIYQAFEERAAILPIVERIDEHRKSRGLLTFDDQMSLAAELSQLFPDIGVSERAKYKVVLLDEYQDTSQSQLTLLSNLFGIDKTTGAAIATGHPVTAVGDPFQSIYGWRGASADTLDSFPAYFPGVSPRYSLSSSWRNDQVILDLANSVIGHINDRTKLRDQSGVAVAELTARTGAGVGELACGLFETKSLEAQGIAEYFEKLWFDPKRAAKIEKDRSSFAVLVRNRKQIPDIEAALRTLRIPVEVVGVGGLVHVPEVADVIATLKVLAFPDKGSALMRLLTGPRFAIGAKDIAALGEFSRKRAASEKRDSRALVKLIEAGNPSSAENDDIFMGSIVDALDEIESAESTAFSKEGYARLVRAAREFRTLRSRVSTSITDLIIDIERIQHLDVEVLVRDGVAHGRRHLDRFLDEAAKYQRTGGSLSQFLNWLEAATSEEGGLKSGSVDVRRDVVQILTIHGAKGAEWDVVAVPGLAKGQFPVEGKRVDNWLKDEGQIPFSLRGDADQLPKFRIENVMDMKGAKAERIRFDEECKDKHLDEEFRLGYVAFTRAKTHLLCTTSWWRDGEKPVPPSALFAQVLTIANTNPKAAKFLTDIGEHPLDENNPNLAKPKSEIWPRDPLGDMRTIFNESVSQVVSAKSFDRAQLVGEISKLPSEPASWARDAIALLDEIARSRNPQVVFLPQRLSVSTLLTLQSDPSELALRIRRPMPSHTDIYAQRGTIFHSWIEKHFKLPTLFSDDEIALESGGSDLELEILKQRWFESDWAKLTPYEVETPFETVLGGVLIRGRMDAIYRFQNAEKDQLPGNEFRYEVVDWKTGKVKDGDDLANATIQLAAYRLAFSRLTGTPINLISAAFHYVAENQTLRPADLMAEADLIALVENVKVFQ